MTILAEEFKKDTWLQQSNPIDVEEKDLLKEIKEKMIKALNEEENLLYVTANQVGYPYQIVALKFIDKIQFFINPLVFEPKKVNLKLSRENEYGLENDFISVRLDKVAIKYWDENIMQSEITGATACLIQQALQNFSGGSISDSGLEVLPEFDEATPEEQEEIVQYYLNNTINTKKEFLEKELQKDKDLYKKYEATRFMRDLGEDKVELEFDKPKDAVQPKMNRKMRRLFKKKLK